MEFKSKKELCEKCFPVLRFVPVPEAKHWDYPYDKMNDLEKKRVAKSFIRSIELYPDKKRKGGCPIKTVHFAFPVSYNGETVYDVSPPYFNNDDRELCL